MNFIINQSPLECGSPSLEVTLKLGAIKGEPQKKGGYSRYNSNYVLFLLNV